MVRTDSDVPFTVALRIPQFSRLKAVAVDGTVVDAPVENGYLKLTRNWKGGAKVVLELDMPAQLVYANPKVRADIGKAAVVKGPVVYCLEEIDNGENLGAFELANDVKLVEAYDADLFGGTLTIKADATKLIDSGSGALYSRVCLLYTSRCV